MFQKVIEERLQALGLPLEINPGQFANLPDFFTEVIRRYADRPAFSCLGQTITYRELDEYANAFAAYLQQHTHLKPGDRIAIQLPNIIQQPIAVLGSLRAGLIVVNTNPLYTERELEHQFQDAGAKGLVVLANVAETAARVLQKTPLETVIVTELGDLHPFPKRQILNFVIRHVKKMVPDYSIPKAIPFTRVLQKGRGLVVKKVTPAADDVAMLQYTGGTTGVAKGAMLTHRNLIANTLQCGAIFPTYGLTDQGDRVIQPLPLYHIYAVIISYIVMLKGGHVILIPNPRDIPALVREMGKWRFDGFCGLNTLFVALCNNEEFRRLDFSHLKMTLSGGMALTRFAAESWKKVTGCDVCEGYGLTETSPVVSVNSGNGNRLGTIGVPVPSTRIDLRDDQGQSVGIGEEGELCIKGPQVMKGYWQREEATAEVLKDGWLASGDIAVMDDQGYLKIVDRKKDMINVSGFKVFPNEVEDVITSHPSILEAAVIGLKDEKTGEGVFAYVVKTPTGEVTEEDVIAHCRGFLAAYKVPKRVYFVAELPKSNVGKVLRRKLKEEVMQKGQAL